MFLYTINVLEKKSIRHEYTRFPSGAVMLDVWHNDKFYVFQFEEFIGLSEVNSEHVAFDLSPDEKFYSDTEFREKLDLILTVTNG
jgi:hypothetical protein